jgi:hypothetical protein
MPQDEIEAFRARLADAGLNLTAAQAEAVQGGWANLQAMIAIIRRPRPPEDEPALIFRPEQG